MIKCKYIFFIISLLLMKPEVLNSAEYKGFYDAHVKFKRVLFSFAKQEDFLLFKKIEKSLSGQIKKEYPKEVPDEIDQLTFEFDNPMTEKEISEILKKHEIKCTFRELSISTTT